MGFLYRMTPDVADRGISINVSSVIEHVVFAKGLPEIQVFYSFLSQGAPSFNDQNCKALITIKC